ncbi:hypothetical protein [Thalassobaculum litoreum]|uniref:Lipoprotein n=1 Tax=Thalassobaculum litoreum DSM 18839 TaxID=1123362 RepID=A0A8G2BI33_9PROT|nr:hypothetical protein [Thalassobaculum litoreum]SDF84003.1 hypothetical protein SAMN05660686_02491 [Thalassobaculum litoreum DSM 18839]
MKKVLLAAVLAAGLQGCAGIAAIPPAVHVGVAAVGAVRAAYCLGITEQGKQQARDLMTAGEQVIYCESGDE